jgi:hypothetical protein
MRVYGTDHPDTLVVCLNLASVWGRGGRSGPRRPSHRAAASRRSAVLGPDNPITLGVRINVAHWRELPPLCWTGGYLTQVGAEVTMAGSVGSVGCVCRPGLVIVGTEVAEFLKAAGSGPCVDVGEDHVLHLVASPSARAIFEFGARYDQESTRPASRRYC